MARVKEQGSGGSGGGSWRRRRRQQRGRRGGRTAVHTTFYSCGRHLERAAKAAGSGEREPSAGRSPGPMQADQQYTVLCVVSGFTIAAERELTQWPAEMTGLRMRALPPTADSRPHPCTDHRWQPR